MAFRDEYKQNIDWNMAHKLCDVEIKTSSKGEQYFIGNLNNSYKIIIRQNKYKAGHWTIQLVPIKYVKAQETPQVQQIKQQAVGDIIAPANDEEEGFSF